MSERQACKLVELSRSVKRYRKRPDHNNELRQALIAMAQSHPRVGYRQLYDRLGRQGWVVNHKRIERLYAEEKLALRRKRRSRKIVCERVPIAVPVCPNEGWAMDFVHDSLFNGRAIRCLTIIDIKSRFIPAIEVAFSLPGELVVSTLNRLKEQRGLPCVITVDNGPEFRSQKLQKWAKDNDVRLDYIKPGTPTQNAFIESLNATFRQECLDGHWFTSLADARDKIEFWRNDYNNERPHRSIGRRTPAEEEIKLFDKTKTESLTCNWS
jgi:putative transposase